MSSESSIFSSQYDLATTKKVISVLASAAATAVLVRGLAHDLLPPEFHDFVSSAFSKFLSRFWNQVTLVIHEFEGGGLVANQLYEVAEHYLGDKFGPTARRFRISRLAEEKHISVAVERGEEVVDVFDGAKFKWISICTRTSSSRLFNRDADDNSAVTHEARSFQLTFHRKNRELAMNSYLPYISDLVENIKQKKRTIKIFTVDANRYYNPEDGLWVPVTFDHPATFETVAMESDQKSMILKDLQQFLKRKEYYKRVGKPWKRAYLLYGPPGTGKSSLIAAMANYLNFDVYDLELSEVSSNSLLRKLLLLTANKSILVVEDIDCAIDLNNKLAKRTTENQEDYETQLGSNRNKNKVTLSGLLNFLDGLWSSRGVERIVILTTNHIEKLDPALLRPGRMDVHINMSYCGPGGFKLLAENYLGIDDRHHRFDEIVDLMQKGEVTPAEVAEQLLKDDDPDVVLQGLVDFIRNKIEKNEKPEEEPIEKPIGPTNPAAD